MACPKCGTGFIQEDLEEDNVYTREYRLGRVWYCVNCGLRLYEYMPKRETKLPCHLPRHDNLGF